MMWTKGGDEYFQKKLETVNWLVRFEMLELVLSSGVGVLIDIKEYSHVKHPGKKKSYYVSLEKR